MRFLLNLIVQSLPFFGVDRAQTVPSRSDWGALNSTLSGRLSQLRPAAAPCHSVSFNAEQCALVKSKWTNAIWRAGQIEATQYTTWEQLDGQWCTIGNLTDVTTPIDTPCAQGNVPPYGVTATTSEDIQSAVKFASRHSLPLIVKGTGHDYLGRSSGNKGLLIWTHEMQNITFSNSTEVCGKKYHTMKVEAGVQWRDAYRGLLPQGRIVPGGADPNVGASGGQVQAGGHSIWSNTFGLTADSVVSFEAITMDGRIRTVSACENKDLFWALRGGGGGTYAIAASTTFQTYEVPDVVLVSFNATVTDDAYRASLEVLGEHAPDLAEDGWGGYFILVDNLFINIYLLPLTGNKTVESANATFQPIISAIASLEGVTNLTQTVIRPVNDSNIGQSTGTAPLLGSRLIPKSFLRSETTRKQVAEILVASKYYTIGGQTWPGVVLGHMVAGGAPSKETDSAILPAWRDAIWHVVLAIGFPEGSPKFVMDLIFQAMTDQTEPLRKITPGGGAYMNEADPRAPSWKEDYFGGNYDRLLSIKQKYDKNGLLRCNLCVGSDLYD